MTAEFVVRPAEPSDVPWIVEAVGEAARAGHVRRLAPARVTALLEDSGHRTFLATVAGRRTGFVIADELAPRLWQIGLIVVARPGRGYGQALLRHVVAHVFDDLRAHRLYLEVVDSNARARALYERVGFTCEGRFRDGFPADDGTFHDLIPYGMLAADRDP